MASSAMTLSVVATSRSSVTAVSASLRERYGWSRFELRRPLAGGYANDICLAEADGAEVVVRIVRAPVDAAGLEWEHALLAQLAAFVAEVPAPLPALDGSTYFLDGESAVVVLPFLAAEPAEPTSDRLAVAAAVARFHRAAAGVQLGPRPGSVRLAELREGMASGRYFAAIGPTARPWPPELQARRAELDAARDWLLAEVQTLAQRGLTTAPIHDDLFHGNVLMRDGAVAAFVDWEEAKIDWVACDLANAMWEFCKAADEEFVHAYRDAGGTVPPAEDDTLIPLIRVRRVLEILRAPYDRHVDWDYQLRNLEAFHALG